MLSARARLRTPIGISFFYQSTDTGHISVNPPDRQLHEGRGRSIVLADGATHGRRSILDE